MRKILALLIALLILGCLQQSTKASYKDISAEEAYELLKNSKVVVIDVRSREEFEKEHIDDAINLVLSPEFKEKILHLDKNATYLVYCNTGFKSRIAAEIMVREGFKNVYSLSGGIDAWKSKGFPVVK